MPDLLELEVRKYRAVVTTDHILKVFDREKPGIQVVHGTVTEHGIEPQRVEEVKPPGYMRSPTFAATWAGDGWCNIDIECGVLRWNGAMEEEKVKRALLKCGFEGDHVSLLLATMKEGEETNYCPRFD
jgi:hypothetical protein